MMTNMKNKKGATMLSAIILLMVILTSTIIVMNTITPTIERGRSFQTYEEAKNVMDTIDAVISELMIEASGASRTINLVSEGTFIISGKEDRIKYSLDLGTNLFDTGSRIKEGNIIITTGPEMKAYEKDIDNDGNTDLVLENDYVLFAIKKLGTPTVYSDINTSSMITVITEKVTATNITPTGESGIKIDNMLNTTWGTGFTELTEKGKVLTSSGIRVYVNSSAGIKYEALFTLSNANDFVELEIKHIE